MGTSSDGVFGRLALLLQQRFQSEKAAATAFSSEVEKLWRDAGDRIV